MSARFEQRTSAHVAAHRLAEPETVDAQAAAEPGARQVLRDRLGRRTTYVRPLQRVARTRGEQVKRTSVVPGAGFNDRDVATRCRETNGRQDAGQARANDNNVGVKADQDGTPRSASRPTTTSPSPAISASPTGVNPSARAKRDAPSSAAGQQVYSATPGRVAVSSARARSTIRRPYPAR